MDISLAVPAMNALYTGAINIFKKLVIDGD